MLGTDARIAFFASFVLTFEILAVARALAGLSFPTVVNAAWTVIAHTGPAYGPEVQKAGARLAFPRAAPAVMTAGTLLGRLERLPICVLFVRRFWRC